MDMSTFIYNQEVYVKSEFCYALANCIYADTGLVPTIFLPKYLETFSDEFYLTLDQYKQESTEEKIKVVRRYLRNTFNIKGRLTTKPKIEYTIPHFHILHYKLKEDEIVACKIVLKMRGYQIKF